jgi:NAD(P)-dependent dehydrogenase (short-subunit alcohol dehydrogenase family)
MALQGKRALVTGGAKRLGRAMSIALAQDGFDVAVHYASSGQEAEELVAELQNLGVRAVALQADLLDEAATQDLVSRAASALGGAVTVLVNNASIFEYDTLEGATRSSWDRHMESNLRAPFVLTQRFAEQVPDPVVDKMGESEAQGCIINMVDQRVRKLSPEFATYTIAKMGLWALTQTAAQALAPRVRVNGIGPGPTLQGGRQTEEQFRTQRQETLLSRGANPKEIVDALRYLVAASGVTGQLICVDGGQHLVWKTADIDGLE